MYVPIVSLSNLPEEVKVTLQRMEDMRVKDMGEMESLKKLKLSRVRKNLMRLKMPKAAIPE